ncbi:MAG: DEAD/DEAH box helicase [Longicatena sp.]
MKFNTLEINEAILKAVEEQGYTTPTPIQEKAIPHALLGKDILGCAQTGTGKTAAFSIPTIQRLHKHEPNKIRSLILTPTRELAIQIQENIHAYARHTNIKSTVIFGGVSQRPQEEAIKRGVDILIATPGRLLDLMKQKIIRINQVEIFILDEADRMLDMGFLFDVKRIIASLPAKKQTLFFSATMPKEIKALTQTLLHDPITIEVTPPSSTVDNIKQSLYYVDKVNKKFLLLDLLKKEKVESALIFTRTKSNANRLGKFLLEQNIDTGIIHGNKSQNARQIALSNFKNKESRVLVATDIAARGIDVNELSHVFNYDIPQEAEAYVHRIGRTGRAGNEGTSISFADIDEVELVKNIQKLIRINIPVDRDHGYPMMITTPSPKKKQRSSKSSTPRAKQSTRKEAGKDTPKKTKYPKKGKPDAYAKKDKRKGTPKPFATKAKGNTQRKPKQGVRGK